ncbi:acyltransferase family protein [Kitasatospora sp. HPMI-4]|uniref:acyltransferase family protein n=1 Tax=Kitasatospora sp. HPMI-4 TaxID=3448443 RepID=UPI003F1D9CE8
MNVYAPATGHHAGIPEAPPARPARAVRLYALDGLRLIAALMVVLFHFVGYDNWGGSLPWGTHNSVVFPTAQPITAYGWLGVQLFFLISGFVICLSSWGRTVRDFAISRLLRLYPAYWFAVLVTSAVLILANGVHGSGLTPSKIFSNLTMLQEPMGIGDIDPVYWTLWAEMRFYLLFAIIAAVGLTYRRVVAFCGLWLLLAILAPQSGIALVQLMAVPDAAPFFVGGIVMYLMHRFGSRPALWVLLLGSWLMAQNQLRSLMLAAERSTHRSLSWTVTLAIVTVFYLLVLAMALGKLTFLNRRWLTTAGVLTYPLYLLHDELGIEAIRHLHGRVSHWALVTGVIVALLALSWLVHRLIEQPLARWLKRWFAAYPPVTEVSPAR